MDGLSKSNLTRRVLPDNGFGSAAHAGFVLVAGLLAKLSWPTGVALPVAPGDALPSAAEAGEDALPVVTGDAMFVCQGALLESGVRRHGVSRNELLEFGTATAERVGQREVRVRLRVREREGKRGVREREGE